MKKLLLLFTLLLLPNIFASGLNISVATPFDTKEHFYVSNNHTREIFFDVSFSSPTLKEAELVLSYDIFPKSPEVSVSLSCDSTFFYNSIDVTEKIQLTTKILKETKTIKLKAQVYDKYKNIIDAKFIFITIIPNHSEQYSTHTITHTLPMIHGYKLSRTLSILENKNDKDVIYINLNKDKDTYFSLSCKASEPVIFYDYFLVEENQIALSVFLNSEIDPISKDYSLNCKLQDGYQEINLNEIKIKYLPKNEKPEIQKIILEEKSKLTSFLSFSSSSVYLFLFIFIVLVSILLFSNSK